MSTAAYAQIPTPSNPVCAYCGVKLKTGEPHKSGCRYYEAPKKEESSSQSTRLKNYTPMPEMSAIELALVNEAGIDGKRPCSHCKSLKHQPWCEVINMQNWARQYKAKAESASTEAERKRALWDYNRMIDNLKIFVNPNFTKADLEAFQRKLEREEAEKKARAQADAQHSSAQSPAPANYQHISSVDIKNGYDKKLGSDSWATAYGKTFPNGQEQWVLYDPNAQEVGQFSKVESAAVPSGLDVFLARGFDGKWGVYNAGGYAIVAPKYESVKVLVAQQGGKSREFYDVTLRDERGVLRHGIINGSIAIDDSQTIPCACDRIELIDRSPSNRGVLAKFTIDGNMGVIDADSGDVLIQPAFSYVNTFFTPKGMYLIVGDGTSFGAYFAETMEVVVSPDAGKSLDQVRNMIDQRDR